MKLAIIGSRDFVDYNRLKEVILDYFSFFDENDRKRKFDFDEIVSGGARGADFCGKKLAEEYNIKLTEFIPNWDLHGKKAGLMRNSDIIKAADVIFVAWDGVSRGTANSLSIAKRLKKDTLIIYF